VGPVEVKEGQAAQDALAALGVQVICGAGDLFVVAGEAAAGGVLDRATAVSEATPSGR
jgi:hypothetical protein